LAVKLRRHLPAPLAHRAVRFRSIVFTQAFYQFCQRCPSAARRALERAAASRLPDGYPLEPNFAPRYDPWDQRMCVVPDGDLFQAISAGRASVVTGLVDSFTETGVRLTTGEELPADIIVTATGLELQLAGGAEMSVDGREVRPGDAYVYRGCMLSGVPNFALCIGYTNASWTLRADLSSRYVCRLLRHMERHRVQVAWPEHPDEPVARPLLDLTSGYIQRSLDVLPKQGARPPWVVRQNYLRDYFTARFGRLARAVRFSGAYTLMMESSPP
jgi:monooxygenase